jgi:hypothetical protein
MRANASIRDVRLRSIPRRALSRGTELPFGADNFALLVSAKHGAPGPFIELRARHFFERRQIIDPLIDAQRLTAGQLFDNVLHADFLGELAPEYSSGVFREELLIR